LSASVGFLAAIFYAARGAADGAVAFAPPPAVPAGHCWPGNYFPANSPKDVAGHLGAIQQLNFRARHRFRHHHSLLLGGKGQKRKKNQFHYPHYIILYNIVNPCVMAHILLYKKSTIVDFLHMMKLLLFRGFWGLWSFVSWIVLNPDVIYLAFLYNAL